jgi:hypothetical protein
VCRVCVCVCVCVCVSCVCVVCVCGVGVCLVGGAGKVVGLGEAGEERGDGTRGIGVEVGVAREEPEEARGHPVLALGPLLLDQPDQTAPLGLPHPQPAPQTRADLCEAGCLALVAKQRHTTHTTHTTRHTHNAKWMGHLGAGEQKPSKSGDRAAGEDSSLALAPPLHLLYRSRKLLKVCAVCVCVCVCVFVCVSISDGPFSEFSVERDRSPYGMIRLGHVEQLARETVVEQQLELDALDDLCRQFGTRLRHHTTSTEQENTISSTNNSISGVRTHARTRRAGCGTLSSARSSLMHSHTRWAPAGTASHANLHTRKNYYYYYELFNLFLSIILIQLNQINNQINRINK